LRRWYRGRGCTHDRGVGDTQPCGAEGLLDLVNLVNEQTQKVGTMIFCVVIDPNDPVQTA
jgi:hypothetical protein